MLDLAFQALSDPTRRAVIERLGAGPASVSELAEPFAMTLAAVVQHVQVLEAAGLVQTSKIGRVRTVQLDPVGLRAAEDWLAARRTRVERQLDRLAEVLAEHPAEPPAEPPTEPPTTPAPTPARSNSKRPTASRSTSSRSTTSRSTTSRE